MKKILSITLIILFIFLLCSCTKDNLEESVKPTIASNVEIIDHLKPTIIYYGKTNQKHVGDDKLEDFNQLLFTNYGLRYKLEYVDIAYQDYYAALQNAPNGGMYYLERAKYYNLSKVQNLFYNISEYLNNNPVDDDQYNEISRHLTTSDNKNYVLPLNPKVYYYHRSYLSDALANLKQEVPVTLQEFTNLAKVVANSDYNKNGIKDEYILAASYKRLLVNFRDIFAAYGCYFNDQSKSPTISFNPNLKSFEDIVQTRQFKEAITYIRYLQDEKLIYISDNIISWRTDYSIGEFEKPFILSGMEKYSYSYEEEGLSSSYYLTNQDYKPVIYKEYNFTGFMFLNGSEDIEKNIETFTKRVFNDIDLIILFRTIGIENDKFDFLIRYPNITIKHYGAPAYDITPSGMENLYYHTSDFVFHEVPYQYETKINEAFSQFIVNYLILNQDYDTALRKYQKVISSIDMENYIQMLNSYIRGE